MRKTNDSPDISTATDPDLRASQLAMRRAAQMARKAAMQTDTGIVVVQNGRMLRISASELRKQHTENETCAETSSEPPEPTP